MQFGDLHICGFLCGFLFTPVFRISCYLKTNKRIWFPSLDFSPNLKQDLSGFSGFFDDCVQNLASN